MEDKKNNLYEFRYEVASERKIIPGRIIIPDPDLDASKRHISDDEKFKIIQRFAFDGDVNSVKKMLSEFPVFKREDLKKMLVKCAISRGKNLEI